MAPGTDLLAPVLAASSHRAPVGHRRVYVLTDVAGPATAPPVAAALVETEQAGHLARLRTLVVASPYRRRGLGRRLLGDLLSELRAQGIRHVRYRSQPDDDTLRSLLRSAGFADEPPGTGTASRAPEVRLVRHL